MTLHVRWITGKGWQSVSYDTDVKNVKRMNAIDWATGIVIAMHLTTEISAPSLFQNEPALSRLLVPTDPQNKYY